MIRGPSRARLRWVAPNIGLDHTAGGGGDPLAARRIGQQFCQSLFSPAASATLDTRPRH